MPILHVSGFNIPTFDFEFSKTYWPELTAIVNDKFGEAEIKDDIQVQEILKDCFTHLGNKFLAVIEQETRASFYITVHGFHENSVALWEKKLKGETLSIDSSDFAAIRRILKIILEQGCAHNLKGHVNFGSESLENKDFYLNTIEHLLYLGYWAIAIGDYITRSQLFSGSIGVQVQEGELNILTYQPHEQIYKYIDRDIPRHSESVVIQNTITDLKVIFQQQLGIDYDIATAFIAHVPDKFALVKPKELLDRLVHEHGYDQVKLESFFQGLTVSNSNRMSFEDCILRNQDVNRYMYRPILEVVVDGERYWLLGPKKWIESFVTLTTNALSFAICPKEWLQYRPIKDFVNHLSLVHDKVLEEPLAELLVERGLMYDANVKSIKTKAGNIPIDVKGVGEIDIIFLDIDNKIIYVCECKHNRSRFDYPNWRRDYSNFVNIYEVKLQNKVTWVTQNPDYLQEHFRINYNNERLSLAGFSVRGIFIINAPTLYIYNGNYKTFTIYDFRAMLDNEYEEITFHFEDEATGKVLVVAHPYFDSLIQELKEQ